MRTETHVVHETMVIDDEELEVTVTMDIVVETPTIDSPGGWTLRKWHACDEREDDVDVAVHEIERMASDALSSCRPPEHVRPTRMWR